MISGEDSILWYEDGDSHANYVNETFIPRFGIQFDNDNERLRANEVCGDDEACLYDLATTKDEDVAGNTREEMTNVVETQEILGQYTPVTWY